MPIKKAEEEDKVETTNGAMETASENKALANLGKEYYRDNANVGLEDLGTEDIPIPSLSVIQSSSKLRDDEGRPYAPGNLYYKALKKVYTEVHCHILVIQKKDLPSYVDRETLERTYIFIGVIDPVMMPFIMYNKSSSYFSARQFIGEVKARKLPMYALDVTITTEKRSNDQGEWYVPVFNVAGLIDDPEKVVTLENLAKNYVENKDVIRGEDEEKKIDEVRVAPVQKQAEAMSSDDIVDPDEIPF